MEVEKKLTDLTIKVTNWVSNGISSAKIKLFDTNLEPIMSNLGNGTES